MKKTILGLVYFSLSFVMSGQIEWIPEGAEWYYTHRSVAPPINYLQLVSHGDTTIDDRASKSLIATIITQDDHKVVDTIYIHQDGDKIYRWMIDDFHLLYDFSLAIGDTLVIDIHEVEGEYELSGEAFLVIDSLTTRFFDGIPLRGQYLRPLISGLDEYAFQFSGWVYEGIGSGFYFVPINQLDCDSECTEGLRCYSDSRIAYNRLNIPCDTIIPLIVNTEAVIQKRDIKIFPNPVSIGEKLKLSYKDLLQYEEVHLTLSDTAGRIYVDQDMRYSKGIIISTQDLHPGIFFIYLSGKEGSYKSSFVVIGN
ncbi:MAG: hypothetical protein ACI9P5_004820 [Saprospiraceae bacterium]|jgi:hypothetical protein